MTLVSLMAAHALDGDKMGEGLLLNTRHSMLSDKIQPTMWSFS